MTGWSSFPLEADVPMSDVIRTGEPLFLASVEERNERYPALADQGQESHALVVVPLAVEGRVFGAMSLSFDRDVEFEPERREMKLTLARQAAQALGALAPLRGRADAARADDLPRRGERAARLVARLQPHAHAGRAAQRPRPRRLVRDRHGRAERRDRAARGRARGSGQGALGLRAAGALPARPGRADGRLRRCCAPASPSSSRRSRRSCWTRRSATTRSCAGSSTSSG